MKLMIVIAVVALFGLAAADEFEQDTQMVDESTGRFLFFNTSSTATSLTLLGALILLGVIFYLVYVGGLLSPATSGYNRNSYQYDQYDANNYDQSYAQFRSSQDGYEFGGYNILEWISTLRDAYENFDYNDIECQKRLICDVLREPTMLGVNGQTIKNTFQMAKYLELMNLPDEVREILDEYMDAESRAEQNKDCKEFFTCPFSISDSYKAYKRPVTAGNDL